MEQTPTKEEPKDVWPLQIPQNAASSNHLKHAISIANKFLQSDEAIGTLKGLMFEDETSIEKTSTQPSLMSENKTSIEKTWVIFKKNIE